MMLVLESVIVQPKTQWQYSISSVRVRRGQTREVDQIGRRLGPQLPISTVCALVARGCVSAAVQLYGYVMLWKRCWSVDCFGATMMHETRAMRIEERRTKCDQKSIV